MKFKQLNLRRIAKTEECPCGSGKKYRACCFNAKDQDLGFDKMLDNEKWLNNFIRDMYKKTDYAECIYYDKEKCKGPIIGAHTLQNNGVLKKLAVKNHVMMLTAEVDKFGGKANFERIGKNKATTFMGFCKEHDDKVFSDIEKEDYTGAEKQKFLYAYRALAQEYHKKNRLMKSLQQSFKIKPSILKESWAVGNYRLRQLDMFDVNEYKKKFDEAFKNEDFSILETIEIILDEEYDFAVTTMFTLTFDLKENRINNTYSTKFERMKSCFLTIVPLENKTLILFSWLKEDNFKLKGYKEQIENLSLEEIKIYLNNMIPMYTENIIFSPRLVEKWTDEEKECFKKTFSGEFVRLDELQGENSIRYMFNFLKSVFKYKVDFLKKPNYDLFRK
ncbi:SEC-C domain-containing protein [Clostridium perfringens]|uniref:SEC-C metal-binding domain-containing protein n=1 Tax=Clostridium perfringens TaxID=1502 RepID=UPI0013E35FF0|nr:SEC-C metal-binding domain-containing protein [Clostridium perfringens]NGT31334.1 SEC-C domain-containing protein [Clostridium perfringens]NGU09054.1 SEC-C domain-containing protein [Clostridium perfringens]